MGKPGKWAGCRYKLRKLRRNQSLVGYQRNHPEATLSQIGKVFSISRQRAGAILKRYAAGDEISRVEEGVKRPDCELLSTCPYYNGMVEMPEIYKEQYCKGDYRWCGRYLVFKALEKSS